MIYYIWLQHCCYSCNSWYLNIFVLVYRYIYLYKYQHLTIDRNYFTTFLNLGGFVFQEPHQLPSCLLPLTPPNPSLQVTRSLEEKQDVYFVLNPITWTSVHRIQQLGQDCTVLIPGK